ncbi:hypothetical protein [Streptomyces sp. CB03238]|uniref:hypothetical protein n=1 Tax=Streptomyces sp. CB03238 TaxID=1907777 RepID=UPI0015C4E63B|nr:hypothetical protein [Streptomyces sp. CB03238]
MATELRDVYRERVVLVRPGGGAAAGPRLAVPVQGRASVLLPDDRVVVAATRRGLAELLGRHPQHDPGAVRQEQQ